MKYKSDFVFDCICNLETQDTVIEYKDYKEGLRQVLKDTNDKKNTVFNKRDIRFLDRLDYLKKLMFQDKTDYLISLVLAILTILTLLQDSRSIMLLAASTLSINIYFAFKELMKFQLDLSRLHVYVKQEAIKPRSVFVLLSLPAVIAMTQLGLILMIVSVLINASLVTTLFFLKLKDYRNLLEGHDEIFDEVLYYTRTDSNKIKFVNEVDNTYSEKRKEFYGNKKRAQVMSLNQTSKRRRRNID